MKKLLALVLAVLMVFSLAACGKTDDKQQTSTGEETKSDKQYVADKGTLVVGITDFAPMDYQEEGSTEWVGFDADLAKLFAESLGVKAEFIVIDWGSKVGELNGKTIDCVWNGMTLGEEVMAAMATSKPYCTNAQVIVVPADKAEQYKTAEACKELSFAVENGSAGKDMAEENGFRYTEVEDQATALFEVKSGTADAAIIDLLMAGAMIGEGTDFADLTYTASLNSEEYGVGFRKGSDLVDAFNAFLEEVKASGKFEQVAEQYGVQEAIIK